MEEKFRIGLDIALVGEIDVRRELAAEGWLTINTNTEKGNFPNVDLIAAKGEESRTIQVKTVDGEKGSHKHCLYMGRAEGWLGVWSRHLVDRIYSESFWLICPDFADVFVRRQTL